MTDDAKWHEGHPVNPADPDGIPVRVVNGIPHIGIIGSCVAVTLTTDVTGFDGTGGLRPHMVVAARLRFDLEMAVMIRDALSAQIEMLTKPRNERPN